MKLTISKERGGRIPAELIGLFFEDINYAADGGLYAEMIENRSFEAREAYGTPGYFYTVDDFMYAWEPCAAEGELPDMKVISGAPVSSANPHYLRVTASRKGQGFTNRAYDGVCLKKGLSYTVSFYARPVTYAGEHVLVSVRKGGRTYAAAEVPVLPAAPYMPFSDVDGMDLEQQPGEWGQMIQRARELDDGKHVRQNAWTKYEAKLTAEEDVRGAEFVMTLDGEGAVEFDLISMFPEDAVAGIFRKDLFDALAELKPGFIRFPGGCIVEGISLDNRYQWKNTIGDRKDRKYMPNLWAFDDERSHEKNGLDVRRGQSHYGQSFGIGFYEYFLLCEMLGAKPLPVLGVGAACQFRSTEVVPVDSPEFGQYIDDALDLIEFANGPADSEWGSIRAAMGHPLPFGMDLIGIGNEQWETRHVDFYERAKRFEAAIHARYPEIRIVGSAGPVIDMPIAKEAWEFYRKEEEKKGNACYAVDEHYYVSPEWMYEHVNFYDDYPDTVGVFAGEYAAHTKERLNDMQAALAEAALLTGIEKNAGVVKLASYAPLMNRIGHSQWRPDLIWFDDAEVYVTPSYQVQRLFAANLGTELIPMGGQEKELQKEKIYVVLSRSEAGEVILKAVNAGEADCELGLCGPDGAGITGSAVLKQLCGTGEIVQDGLERSVVKEEELEIRGSVLLPAATFSVFILRVE